MDPPLHYHWTNFQDADHPGGRRPARPGAEEAEAGAVVADARTVLVHTQALTGDPVLVRRVETLRRILRENLEADEAGAPREKPYQAKGPDLLVSQIDPDARYGAKSDTKHFTGYKANVTETVRSRFLTTITALPGNRPDGEPTVEAVGEQHAHDLRPATLIRDTADRNGPARKALKGHGTELVAPLRPAPTRTRTRYPKRMFHYDRAQSTLTCPAGVTAQQTIADAPRQLRKFHFPLPVCGACPRRPACAQAKDGRRSVGISDAHEDPCTAETVQSHRGLPGDQGTPPTDRREALGVGPVSRPPPGTLPHPGEGPAAVLLHGGRREHQAVDRAALTAVDGGAWGAGPGEGMKHGRNRRVGPA